MPQAITNPTKAIESSSKSSSGDTRKPKKPQKNIKNFLATTSHQRPPKQAAFRANFITKRNRFQSLTTTLNQNSSRAPGYQVTGSEPPNGESKILLLNGISKRASRGGDLIMELLKLEEVMAVLKCSRTTLWRLRREGLIRECRQGGLIWITKADLDKFIRQQVLAGRAL